MGGSRKLTAPRDLSTGGLEGTPPAAQGPPTAVGTSGNGAPTAPGCSARPHRPLSKASPPNIQSTSPLFEFTATPPPRPVAIRPCKSRSPSCCLRVLEAAGVAAGLCRSSPGWEQALPGPIAQAVPSAAAWRGLGVFAGTSWKATACFISLQKKSSCSSSQQ